MTAVEWLEDCLTEQHPNGSFVWNTRADLEALFKQAKEMEKQQQGYSEEDMKFAYEQGARLALISQSPLALHKGEFPNPDEWFEQFKKK
jgi:hypothetical protein